MKDDPRYRNELFDATTLGTYLGDYASAFKSALQALDIDAVEKTRALIEGAASAGKRIFAIGNGGSAAIADHLCCDLTKGTHVSGQPVVDTTSLNANVALYSAIANDFGFEKVFSTQVNFLGKPGDVLLAISSSGNSPNILAAVAAARAIGMTTVGLSGFSGGGLKTAADVSIHVDANNYGIVEDVHQAIMHILAQYIALKRES